MTESQILEIAIQLSGTSREQFLRAACQSDAQLRRRLDQRLAAEPHAAQVDDQLTVDTGSTPSGPNDATREGLPAGSSAHRTTLPSLDDDFSLQQSGGGSGDDTPTPDRSPFDSPSGPPQPGESIGPYRLLARLGQGGMGDVWRAQQLAPVRRDVALKVIKAGINSTQILARFAAERQALALMNHPFIAKILDAGTTRQGQPYFVMELVSGVPLAEFCDQNELNIEKRLRLFVDICRGVQHAHQKGIIHRDLKPGNILVTMQDGRAIPKIIDFGLFKAFGEEAKLLDISLQTNLGQILGTLKYMSPEQASLETTDIDTRTDIYALGVILYELLTGSTPLDDPLIKGQAALKVLEFIRERDPVRPSSKLSSSTDAQRSVITRRRGTDSRRLTRALIGDLDWIVLKALEKDRARRYDSAAGFAEDIERFLHNEPIIARPPSVLYRFKKFTRKHRVTVTAAALLVLSLLAGILGTTWGMRDAILARNAETQARLAETAAKQQESTLRQLAEERQRQAEEAAAREMAAKLKSEQRAAQIETINNSVFDIFADFDMEATKANDEPVETVLANRLADMGQRLDETLIEDPVVLANLWDRLGRTLNSLGLSQEAVEYLEKALELRQQQAGPAEEMTLSTRANLAAALRSLGQIDRALPLYQQVVEQQTALNGEDDPATLIGMSNLALGHGAAGDYSQAIALLETVLAKRQAVLGLEHEDTLDTMRNLATGYLTDGQPARAIKLLEKIHELTGLGQDNVDFDSLPLDALSTINSLAAAYEQVGQVNRAIPLFELAWQTYRRRLGKDHPRTLNSLNNLAYGYQANRQLDQAAIRLAEFVELSRAKYGEQHPETLKGKASWGATLVQMGDHAQAIPLLEEVRADYRARLGEQHPNTLSVLGNLGAALRAADRHVDALPLFEQAYQAYREKLGDDNPQTVNSLNNLAAGYLTAGRMDDAVALFERALEQRRQILGPQHPMTIVSASNLGNVYVRAGRLEQAIPLLEMVLESLTQQLGADHPEVIKRTNILAVQYRDLVQLDKAIELMQRVMDWQEQKLGAEHPETLSLMNTLAATYWSNRQLDQSIPLFEQTLQRMEKALGRDDSVTQATVANLGVNYRDDGRVAQSLPLLTEAYQASLKVPTLFWVGPQRLLALVQAGQTAPAIEMAKQLTAAAHAGNEPQSLALANQLLAISRATISLEGFSATLTNLEECLTILESQKPDDWPRFEALSLLGQELLQRQDLVAAEPLLEQSFAGLQARLPKMPPIRRTALPRTARQLVALYQRLERPEHVAKWQAVLDGLRDLE